MIPMITKILIVEHNSTDLELIQYELKKGNVNYITEIVQTEKEYEKALHNFKPDIILSNYTSPSFEGLVAFKIKQNLAPQTPFIFVSESIGEENAIELIKNGVTDFVLKERLFNLIPKVKRALKEAAIRAKKLTVIENRLDTSLDIIGAPAEEEMNKKRVEKAIAIEKQQFYDLYLQAPFCMGKLKGPNHIYEMANPLYMKLIGKRNIIGKSVKEVRPEAAAQGFIEILDQVYKTGVSFSANEMLIKLDKDNKGEIVDLYSDFLYQARRNNEGHIDGILFFAVDVTEQVVSRKKIEESENRFRALIEKSEEMITLSTEDGKIIYGSPSIRKIFGYSADEVPHKFSFDLIHPDDLKEFMKKRKKILTTPGKSFYHQQRVHHKNGNWIWCENTITNMLHEPGINALVANFRDITEKKRLEQHREFDRNNLTALINNTDDLMWSVDKYFKLITSNKSFDKITKLISGKTIEKGSNMLASGFTAERLARYKISCERAFAGEAFTETEYRAIPIETWSEISYCPIRKGNEIIGTACHSRNITERKQAELNLEKQNKELAFQNEEKEDRAAELIIANKELAYQNDEKENRAAELIIANKELAFQNDEKENRAAELVIANKELAFQNEEKEDRAAELAIANEELAFQNEEKENRAAELIIANHELAFQNDEKENRAAELVIANHELAFQNDEKENRAAELVIANHELAFQNDEKENRAAELVIANKELAFQNEEKENRAAELVIANKELAFQNEEKENRAAELVIANKELAFQNEEKENRAAELVIANKELAFQNEEKENRATELINTNNELIKTNTELDRFVYSVSHDLRSPLTSVLGLISFIEEESKEPDTLEHVKMIRNSINRLDEFIKNILSYSRNNRTGLEVKKIPLQKTIVDIVDSLHSMKQAKGIHFEIDIKELQPFYSDSLRVNTILENLISNAIKYHKKNQADSYIKIIGQSDNEKLQLTIADNGIGIAPAHHNKIFDMFFRLSGKTEGSGIGLYIVKDTVEILQGSIEIQSEKGTGTTFIITLKNLKP
jgi:PAS domain S-box-containing protein